MSSHFTSVDEEKERKAKIDLKKIITTRSGKQQVSVAENEGEYNGFYSLSLLLDFFSHIFPVTKIDFGLSYYKQNVAAFFIYSLPFSLFRLFIFIFNFF